MKNAIYSKIARIQAQIKGLKRTKDNKFQGYKYFAEEQAIQLLKPLLEKEKLAVVFSDTEQLHYEKQGKDHIIRYIKKVSISDGENDTLTYKIWAMGQDADISKSKGKAETYAAKYFYSKFFMIPIVDTLDPDQQKSPEQVSDNIKVLDPEAESVESIEKRHKDKLTADEFLRKHGLLKDEEKK